MYSKSMEKLRNKIDVKLVRKEKYQKKDIKFKLYVTKNT